ncbi:MAG: hypothetical protein JWN09_2270 [Microbacteriaceae bacterium]|jgi:uncharacterized membrane protein (DUF485 family)|nr:hypothetical protein [Microbacteriaceae bacterium]
METMSEPRARTPRRQRSATESLLSIALLLEAVLVFFITITVFGLNVLPAGLAFGGGAVLFVVLLLDGRLVRYPAGVWLGWALQAVLVAAGLLVPLMYFVGAIFLAIWIYCFVAGRRLDRRNAQLRSETTTNTEESP